MASWCGLYRRDSSLRMPWIVKVRVPRWFSILLFSVLWFSICRFMLRRLLVPRLIKSRFHIGLRELPLMMIW